MKDFYDYCTENGVSPLPKIISESYFGNYVEVRKILALGADINTVDKDCGYNALMAAVENNKTKLACYLIDNKADVHQVDNAGYDILFSAVENQNIKIIHKLIEKRVNLNHQIAENRSAFFLAVSHNMLNIVRIFLENGVDLTMKDKFGWTALYVAVNKGHYEVCKLLLEYGIAVDDFAIGQSYDSGLIERVSPLRLAADKKDMKIYNLLIANGANPRICASDSISPANIAGEKAAYLDSSIDQFKNNLLSGIQQPMSIFTEFGSGKTNLGYECINHILSS